MIASRAHSRGTLAFLPAFHVIGFTNNFLYNLYAGVRCMVHVDAPSVPNSGTLLLRACAELRPSILDTVPALLTSLIEVDPCDDHPSSASSRNGSISEDAAATLRSCAAVLYGGAQLADDTAEALSASGVALYSQYGQTELGGMALMGGPGVTPGWLRPVGGIGVELRQSDAGPRDRPASSGEPSEPYVTGELMLSGVGSLTPGMRRAPPSLHTTKC